MRLDPAQLTVHRLLIATLVSVQRSARSPVERYRPSNACGTVSLQSFRALQRVLHGVLTQEAPFSVAAAPSYAIVPPVLLYPCAGHQGKVLKVIRDDRFPRVIVQGANIIKKSITAMGNQPGFVVSLEVRTVQL